MSADSPPEVDTSPVTKQRRVKDILWSTMIVGGGSLVTVINGIVRGKLISMLVGPAGIGLQGLLQSAMRTTSAMAGMGLSTSGVREVARLRGAQDTAELGHTLRALRLATLTLGTLAAIILFLFHRPLGRALLDTQEPGWGLAVVGLGVFATVLYAAYDAFLRGSRRVAMLTKASVLANALSTVFGIALVIVFGDDGISWALVSQPICLLALAAFVGRDYPTYLVPAVRERTKAAFVRVIRMGVVLAATSFITTATQLGARVLVAHATTLDDVGYFQGAWAVSVLYLGFVLGAMSLDYYPRLAEMGNDRKALAQAVNEQAKVSFLLAGPALLGMLTLSSQVVTILYTSKFVATVGILRWQLVGDVLKIGSWTLSYLVLARGLPRVYFLTELSWNATYLGVLAALLPSLGVAATGAAYVAASAVYFTVLCVVANRLAGFVWTPGNVAMMATIGALAAITMTAHLLLAHGLNLAVGAVIALAFGFYCLRRLAHEAGFARLRRRGRGSPPEGGALS
jgi:PST family polysaccharide transporter